MWRSLKLAGSITVLVIMLSIHSVEAFAEGHLPDKPGEWAYIILFALDAALVVQEVTHHVVHFENLEHRASLAQGVAILAWTTAVALTAICGAAEVNGGDVTPFFFLGMCIFGPAVHWKMSIDKRIRAEKQEAQIRNTGGIQLEMVVMERWNGTRRLVVP